MGTTKPSLESVIAISDLSGNLEAVFFRGERLLQSHTVAKQKKTLLSVSSAIGREVEEEFSLEITCLLYSGATDREERGGAKYCAAWCRERRGRECLLFVLEEHLPFFSMHISAEAQERSALSDTRLSPPTFSVFFLWWHPVTLDACEPSYTFPLKQAKWLLGKLDAWQKMKSPGV